MGYLEAPLSLNPAEREPKTTIVTRVKLGTVLTTAAELAQKEGWSEVRNPTLFCPSLYFLEFSAHSLTRSKKRI